jgi:hypothetical protein
MIDDTTRFDDNMRTRLQTIFEDGSRTSWRTVKYRSSDGLFLDCNDVIYAIGCCNGGLQYFSENLDETSPVYREWLPILQSLKDKFIRRANINHIGEIVSTLNTSATQPSPDVFRVETDMTTGEFDTNPLSTSSVSTFDENGSGLHNHNPSNDDNRSDQTNVSEALEKQAHINRMFSETSSNGQVAKQVQIRFRGHPDPVYIFCQSFSQFAGKSSGGHKNKMPPEWYLSTNPWTPMAKCFEISAFKVSDNTLHKLCVIYIQLGKVYT